jgi:putative transposase
VKKRFTEEQISRLREAETGLPVAELCRRHGFSEASYYLWRNKFGGMSVSDAKRLKCLCGLRGFFRGDSLLSHIRGSVLRLCRHVLSFLSEPQRVREKYHDRTHGK